MKKLISLFTTLALLISICTAIPISVSAQDSVAEDLSQYLDNAKRYDDFKIPDESLSELMDTPLTAKALTYVDIEQYSWSSEYNESFFNDNFLLFIKWFEPVGAEPSIYSLSSMIRKGDTMEIELEGDAETLGSDVVRIYCAAIELPRSLCDLKYNAAYNKWIHISEAQDLKDFADDVNSGNTYEGKTVVLDNDIDLSQICGEDINGVKISWEPIGVDNLSEEEHTNIFNGEFDGRGHTVSGLYIYSKYSYDRYQGLFGYIGDNAVIRNLTVDGSIDVAAQGAELNFSGVYPPSAVVGAIAGSGYGDIENCHNKANINVYGYISACGGIIGRTYGNITGCSNNGTVVGVSSGLPNGTVDNVGGICGDFLGIKISDCCNTAAVNGDRRVGGVVGSISHGTIINCYNNGIVGGNKYVSAFLGENVREDSTVIENCYYLENCNADRTTFENDFGISKTADQFASGEVAYLLGEAWGQNIGVDKYPVIGGSKVYYTNNIYTNTMPEYPYEITLLRFTDTNGNEIIVPEQGKSFIVEADITKTQERDEKDYLFVAVYDNSGALLNIDYVKAKFAVDGEYSFGFNIPAQNKEIGSIKAFVWNMFDSMQPLAESKILAPVVPPRFTARLCDRVSSSAFQRGLIPPLKC